MLVQVQAQVQEQVQVHTGKGKGTGRAVPRLWSQVLLTAFHLAPSVLPLESSVYLMQGT